jgi:AcrR family transcriptional regulator
MAALTRTPREQWVQAGLRALAAGGPDGVRIEKLARALKVSKGGFYWHFADRQALLTEMLEAWEQQAIEDVIVRVEARGGDGRARLRRLFGLASEAPHILAVDLAVRDWARRDRGVAQRLRRADNRRMVYMRDLFATFCSDAEEAEVRALIAFAIWIGDHLIAADGTPRTRAELLSAATRRLLA